MTYSNQGRSCKNLCFSHGDIKGDIFMTLRQINTLLGWPLHHVRLRMYKHSRSRKASDMSRVTRAPQSFFSQGHGQ